MKGLKIDFSSISLLFLKMTIITISIDAMISLFYDDFEIGDLVLSFLIFYVGLSFIYSCALMLPPKMKNNPLTLGNDIVESIYSEAVADLYVDDEIRGVFKENIKELEGVSLRELQPIENANELFVMLNTYQKVLVTIKTNRSTEIYNILELYKNNAKFMLENLEMTKAFSKSR
ncbi:hypothetical protein [Cohnella soli]|uniref:Uncharacterized protein n=1 Tax=Cohnella soli TaxID=425005 RepID=A0ABW0I2F8_9BACL